ncbi:PTS sugar transporter subunit IIA [Streptomyces sp. 3N207]|uniref:PTS sugar transporter subunit IIA n=1 Tax=Streptomyces sp. 3N207 TaxID=3457417 RepID=UPI003FD04F61
MITVLAPCPGRLVPLAEVPDPVFAAEMVGPGVGIDPDPGEVTVVSPIAGKALKVHPHAFVVLGEDSVSILVHLGINTVRLEGRGFEVLAEEGSTVEEGGPMVLWNPSTISGPDMSPMVLVVAMDQPKGSVRVPEPGGVALIGEKLFEAGG